VKAAVSATATVAYVMSFIMSITGQFWYIQSHVEINGHFAIVFKTIDNCSCCSCCTKVTLGLYIEIRKVTECLFIFLVKPRLGRPSSYAHSSVQALHKNLPGPGSQCIFWRTAHKPQCTVCQTVAINSHLLWNLPTSSVARKAQHINLFPVQSLRHLFNWYALR